jgi:hypothetical protein
MTLDEKALLVSVAGAAAMFVAGYLVVILWKR